MTKKVLLIIESCNPEWASVPLVGYNFFDQISKFCNVTLVTHERNREALEKLHPSATIFFITPSKIEKAYYKIIARLSTFRGAVIWPLRHTLQYPIYFFFDKAVDRAFGTQIENGSFDLVHALTPILPRYPVQVSKRCGNTPFVLGPVNGGVPFPKAFEDRGKREFSQLNFLRKLGAALTPNYRDTYKKSKLILSGSTYTKKWIEDEFHLDKTKVRLFFENGVPQQFYYPPRSLDGAARNEGRLNALFVGRLVPYKGVDMLIKAIKGIDNIHLTIVGNGAEFDTLNKLVKSLDLSDKVTFTGWIPQSETARYYQQADLFCFPSVREFGGAVVMEAMAAGLPCAVVDNGGVGEYVDESTGYKVPPKGESFVISRFSEILKNASTNRTELKAKARNAYEKAIEFSWQRKGEQLNKIYEEIQS